MVFVLGDLGKRQHQIVECTEVGGFEVGDEIGIVEAGRVIKFPFYIDQIGQRRRVWVSISLRRCSSVRFHQSAFFFTGITKA